MSGMLFVTQCMYNTQTENSIHAIVFSFRLRRTENSVRSAYLFVRADWK